MAVTNYVWDGQQYLMETDESNTTQAVWTNEPDEYTNLISQRRGVATQYPHFDALGSTRQLTDANETITDTRLYDAWGTVVTHTGVTAFPLQFAGVVGYYYDPDTETFYIIRRVYEPETGQWLSVDPVDLLQLLVFQNFPHSYIYASNNPLRFRDPSGLITVTPLDQRIDDLKCGNLAYISWDFLLEKEAPCDGYIVQKVSYKCKFSTCQRLDIRKPVEIEVDYYEAWRVKEGAKLSLDRGRFLPRGPVVTDTAAHASQNRSIGSVKQKGEIRFYCKNKSEGRPFTGNLNTLWKKESPIGAAAGPCSISAGSLPRKVGDAPAFWQDEPIESSATRSFSLWWDCCPCGEDVEYFNIIAGGEPIK